MPEYYGDSGGPVALTKEELYQLLGHEDILKDLDVKTLVLDLVRHKLTQDEILTIFWDHLGDLEASYVKGYRYRRFSS